MSIATSHAGQQVLHRVAENLYRAESTDIYYAIVKAKGKQIKRSLKTSDRQLARRRLDDLRNKVGRMTMTNAQVLRFAEYDENGHLVGGLAKLWFDISRVRWSPSVVARETYTVKELSRHFGTATVRNITVEAAENWATERAAACKPRTYNRERLRLVEMLGYAVERGLLLDNPAEGLPKRPEAKHVFRLPTEEQFAAILKVMRSEHGKPEAKDSADLAEGLSYLGCRKGDASWVEWGHFDFKHDRTLITGHPDTCTKNGEQRTIPLFAPLKRLLLDMRAALPAPPKPTDKVFRVKSCRKAFETACKQLGLPHYPPHHTWRRFFITNCVMAGVDFKTIAAWVGHKDGGVLVAKTYSVLTDEHSRRMAQRVTFDAAAITDPEPAPDNIIPMPLPHAVND